ncbi:MAG: cytochrome-c peroxidase, partial [Gemmatimonadota bacterium]
MRRREAALRAEAIAGAALAVALLVPGVMQAQEHPPGPVPLGLELYMPVPADNPSSPERTALGRRPFFDPVLSRDRTVSCASCHRPEHRFADTLARSRGVGGRRPARNTPSLLNVGYQGYFFWDGRVTSLEDQVVQPIAHPDEMGLPLGGAVARLAADERYRAAFARASGDAPTEAHLARALASYVRSLRSGGSAADRYAAGDTAALGPLAREGRRIFLGRGRCAACHGGPL